MIWLAESVHASFVGYRRANGLSGLSDSELYEAFDLTYDYDIWPIWQLAVQGFLILLAVVADSTIQQRIKRTMMRGVVK